MWSSRQERIMLWAKDIIVSWGKVSRVHRTDLNGLKMGGRGREEEKGKIKEDSQLSSLSSLFDSFISEMFKMGWGKWMNGFKGKI